METAVSDIFRTTAQKIKIDGRMHLFWDRIANSFHCALQHNRRETVWLSSAPSRHDPQRTAAMRSLSDKIARLKAAKGKFPLPGVAAQPS
ncbi:hypothetical protein, partial [Aphanothece microscopica]|uniref:hypothetical protein n=1 Tax=Aphanothece microscopica TaxID=1049561 RepID=UPI0039854385